MSKHREDFLNMLKSIDDELHEEDDDERDKGADRLIAQVKEGLPTSSHLITWTQSVKSRYPISTTTKWLQFVVSTAALLLGLGLFVFDIGTDSFVNKQFWDNSQWKNISNSSSQLCLNKITFQIEDYLQCQPYTGDMLAECFNQIYQTLAARVKNCPGNKDEEIGRFAPEEWTDLFGVTLFHLILPWILYLITAIIVTPSYPYTAYILGPIINKIKIYVFECQKTKLQRKNPKDVISKMAKIKKKLSDYTEIESLHRMVEVSAEASFQFYLQTQLILPQMILVVVNAYNNSEVSFREQLVNLRFLSILSSFAVLSISYYTIKNMSKKEALTGKSGLIIFLKTTAEALIRITLFGMFIYLTDPEGRFNTVLVVGLYYGHVLLLFLFNIIFNTSAPKCNVKYFLGLLLNSLSSSFSYNYYNYDDILNRSSEKKKTIKQHEPSFLRQSLFTILILCENLVLTVWTVVGSHGKMTDRFGTSHELSTGNLASIMGCVWGLQFFVFGMMVAYYGTHPASVSLTDIKSKLKIHIWGVHWVWKKGCCFVKGK
jgi:hypothetical protein